MNAQILIKSENNWFEFSKSKTGQLDYVGKWENNTLPQTDGYQKLASSPFFSPSWYVYLLPSLCINPQIFVAPDVDVSDKDIFDYLIHIGPVLAAVDAKDSLLAGELFLRRHQIFEKFAQLTSYILSDLSVEILFSLCYGKMQEVTPDSVGLIFDCARKNLEFDSSKETLDQAFMRYFKNHKVTVTLPLVGTGFYRWEEDCEPQVFENLWNNLSTQDLPGSAQTLRDAKRTLYQTLEVAVQAEPYNHVDKNSIICYIENVESKLCGNPGLEKAGHIRALAAKIIRESHPQKVSYDAKLNSIGSQIVVALTVG